MKTDRELTLKMIDTVLRFAEAISFQLSKEVTNAKLNSLEAVISVLHKRMHSNLISISYFVHDEKNVYHSSPAILFRAVALDYMYLLYLNSRKNQYEGSGYKWKNPISVELKKEVDKMLGDQLWRLYKDGFQMIEILFKTKKEYLEWAEKIRQTYPPEFHYINNDTKRTDIEFHSASQLFKELKKILPDDALNQHRKKIWSYYAAYSKIDHFGIVSMKLESQPVDVFIVQLRQGIVFIHDALSIIGCEFMQVPAFADMSEQVAKKLLT